MKYAGIICEYNPFHLGHKAHIELTRLITGDDTGIICVMSGNFVQRGEPAVMAKHKRAAAALLGGADLVLELPTVYAVSSAERFCSAGVELLAALNIPVTLSFGSEGGDVEELYSVAEGLLGSETGNLISAELKKGLSYPAARQAALEKLLGSRAGLLKSPNNTLGIEYIKAIIKNGYSRIRPVTVKRVFTEHNGGENEGYAPASYIRDLMERESEDFARYMTAESAELYKGEVSEKRAPVTLKNFERAVLYRLRQMTKEEFAALPDVTEGLENRLFSAAADAVSYDEFINLVKTKRYAMSRIRRIVLWAVLGVTAQMQKMPMEYIRVLGFNEKGREILRSVKKSAALPIITKPASAKKINEKGRRIFDLEARATDIYGIMMPSAVPKGGEWRENPVSLI